MSGNKLQENLKTMREVMFFPEITIVIIPSLIFLSLFVIPESYSGITKFTKTLDGSYQNKWLFDMLYVGSIVLFLHIYANAFFNKKFSKNKYIFIKFFKPRVKESNVKHITALNIMKILFYILAIFFLYMMNSNASFIQSDGTGRRFIDFNGFVFLNYFISMFGIYGSFVFLGYTSFLTIEDMEKGQKIFHGR